MKTLMSIVICCMLLTIPNYVVCTTIENTEAYGVEDSYDTVQPNYEFPPYKPPKGSR